MIAICDEFYRNVNTKEEEPVNHKLRGGFAAAAVEIQEIKPTTHPEIVEEKPKSLEKDDDDEGSVSKGLKRIFGEIEDEKGDLDDHPLGRDWAGKPKFVNLS